MSRCLSDQALVALHHDGVDPGSLGHLRACATCSGRFRAMVRDLSVIDEALASAPSPALLAGHRARQPLRAWRRLATAAAVAVVILIAELGLWRVSVRLTEPDGMAENLEAIQFVDEVSSQLLGSEPRDVALDGRDSETPSVMAITDLVTEDHEE
jgi:hypothetical protein